jgi:serine/threonine protein kinase/tetratricopeptide (TPR) repeat protein
MVSRDATTGSGPAIPSPAGTESTDTTRPAGAPASPARSSGERKGPLTIGQSFGRYHIIRSLGMGGMGAVYHAWDGELGATVALKVIRPEATRDPEAEREMQRRFKQELVLARKVTHKNVVRIHDLGEINGIKFISMPYLEGSDLASVLKERQKLPVPEALRIIRDVAAGLVAAHEAGIVHRDLKPANIMVQKDHAIIMDFGIARSTGGPQEAPFQGLPVDAGLTNPMTAVATMAGTIVGTMRYMAPEQAKGQPVDQRADIYALGLIFADMLVGGRGSADTSPVAELRGRLDRAPQRVRATDQAIPAGVDALIARCVEPDPAKRFQTSVELVAALNRLNAEGKTIRERKVIGLPIVAVAAIVLLAVTGSVVWYLKRLIPPPVIPPMKVVIADFDNRTNDASFDQTLEPILRLRLEEASFITAYDRSSISRFLTSGGSAQVQLKTEEATDLARKEGVGAVVTGLVEPHDDGFAVSIKVVQPQTAQVLASASGRADSKQDVLSTIATLAASVRSTLGDETSDSRFTGRTNDPLSATSLEVVQQYAMAMDALSNSRNDDALTRFRRAVELDRNFGLAYAGMAIASRNLDRHQDAIEYVTEARRHLDSMTERERFRTRGLFYLITAAYEPCVDEYGELIKKYPADAAAHNNLALCATHMRDFTRSLEARRQAKAILPQRSVYRFNLAIDSTYAGDFRTGEQEAREAQALGSSLGSVALAFAQLAQNRVADALTTYEALGRTNAAGMSRASIGLAELAAYEGRYAEAVRILTDAAQTDLASKNGDRAADKLAALAYTQLLRGERDAARSAARRAIAASDTSKIRFLTGRIFAEIGDIAAAQQAAAKLSEDGQAESDALSDALQGTIFLALNQPRAAVRSLQSANKIVDTWIARFDLGRAYLATGQLTQADSEFDRCLTRRGEALSLFLDDEPTFSYLPALYYYQGRVREGMKTAAFAEPYRTYLSLRGRAGEDPLLAEVRRRAGN